MICPVCGGDELLPERMHLMPYEWLGYETMLEFSGQLCPICGEIIMSRGACGAIEKQSEAFREKMREKIPSAHEVQFLRKGLKLSLKEAGHLFGVGEEAFARYESGEERAPLALFQLLWLLNKHPRLLVEIRR